MKGAERSMKVAEEAMKVAKRAWRAIKDAVNWNEHAMTAATETRTAKEQCPPSSFAPAFVQR